MVYICIFSFLFLNFNTVLWSGFYLLIFIYLLVLFDNLSCWKECQVQLWGLKWSPYHSSLNWRLFFFILTLILSIPKLLIVFHFWIFKIIWWVFSYFGRTSSTSPSSSASTTSSTSCSSLGLWARCSSSSLWSSSSTDFKLSSKLFLSLSEWRSSYSFLCSGSSGKSIGCKLFKIRGFRAWTRT